MIKPPPKIKDQYTELAATVVALAVDDYYSALNTLKNDFPKLVDKYSAINAKLLKKANTLAKRGEYERLSELAGTCAEVAKAMQMRRKHSDAYKALATATEANFKRRYAEARLAFSRQQSKLLVDHREAYKMRKGVREFILSGRYQMFTDVEIEAKAFMALIDKKYKEGGEPIVWRRLEK